jgi:glutathione S-transferase
MKLFYSPNSCALAAHIAALEGGLVIERVEVTRTAAGGKVAAGMDYATINPKGKVPALEVEGGYLTETQVILQYLASLAPERLPLPGVGIAHFRALETLNFLAMELHGGFVPLFTPLVAPAHKAALIESLCDKLSMLEEMLGPRPFMLGERFSIADAYAFTVLGWPKFLGVELSRWPALAAYQTRIAARPRVRQALLAEGLLTTD